MDREKVIKESEEAIDILAKAEEPTFWMDFVRCAFVNALAMLKEQETDAEIEGGGRDWWYVCGECRAVIDSSDSYCSKCGRRIRWKRLGGNE